MIVHSIVVFTPKIQRAYGAADPKITSQAELDAYIAACPIQKGMYIKYKTSYPLRDLYGVFYVCGMVTDIKELVSSYQGEPNVLKVVNLGTDNAIVRYEEPTGLTPLSDEEMAAYVTNNALALYRSKPHDS